MFGLFNKILFNRIKIINKIHPTSILKLQGQYNETFEVKGMYLDYIQVQGEYQEIIKLKGLSR